MKAISKNILPFLKFHLHNRASLLFLILLACFIFLRFYELPERAIVGWDQADSAWAAKTILLDNPLRLEGVPIKGNASMFLGPLYYYLITPFYFLTNLDMLASPIFAAVVSVISFVVFYHVTKKLFDTKLALVASFIYTFSLSVMNSDRVQAAYILTPIISYIIFYFLYKFLTGHEKYILYFAAIVGFGFHIHFTTVFYLIILVLALPFFPRTKKTLIYSAYAILILLVFLFPMLFAAFSANQAGSGGILGYLSASYHGLHLTRFLQLTHDGLISLEKVVQLKMFQWIAWLILPIFLLVFNFKPKKEQKNRLLFSYLLGLWFLIPWLVFSTYTGELTDYYFSLPLPLVISMVAFLLIALYRKKFLLFKGIVILLLSFYAINNVYWFFNIAPGNYLTIKATAEETIKNKQELPFEDRNPLYYTFYVYKYLR